MKSYNRDLFIEHVDIDCEIKRVSRMAYYVSDGAVTEWVPKSQIKGHDYDNEFCPGQTVTLTIPEWLAKEKGFI